jgi:hypothetical protein
MKKYLSFLALLFHLTIAKAQDCTSEALLQYQIGVDATILDSLDSVTVRYMEFKSLETRASLQTIYVPVVVHVVYNASAVNVTDSQINTALSLLNSAYANIGGPSGLGAAQKIVFCLAKRDPSGSSSTGITRHSVSFSNFQAPTSTSAGDDALLKSNAPWPRENYLNIWITDIAQPSVKGYSTFPWATAPGDGIVLDYQYLNTKTLIHEAGHWLGLWDTHHTQLGTLATCANSNCNSAGDQVCDTPPETVDAFTDGYVTSAACTQRHDCNGNLISAANYMENNYDNCRTYFTPDQVDRVRAMLAFSRSAIYYSSLYYPETIPIECTVLSSATASSTNKYLGSCYTLEFSINGEATNHVVNVCLPNITLMARDYGSSCEPNSTWMYKCTHSEKLCAHTSNMWQAASKTYDGLFNNICACLWYQLFIEVVEVDENLNIIGTAQNQWFYFFDNDPSVSTGEQNDKSFNLYDYLPNGVPLQAGKYYKIKIASTANGLHDGAWVEQNGYIRTYQDNITISNKTVTHDQFGDIIAIDNCLVPFGNNIKVTAKTSIAVNANTNLKDGRYYISNFTCADLQQFHRPGPSVALDYETAGAMENVVIEDQTDQVRNPESIVEDILSVNAYPNPNNGNFEVLINDLKDESHSITLSNSFGSTVWQQLNSDTKSFNIDFQSQPSGLYYLHVTSESGKTTVLKISKFR